jgi:hypothetical protein
MKISVKTLKGNHFDIDASNVDTVSASRSLLSSSFSCSPGASGWENVASIRAFGVIPLLSAFNPGFSSETGLSSN